MRRCSEHKRRGKQKNLVHSSPKRQLNFATASEAAAEEELFFPCNLHNTAAGTLGMCFFIELICEELPLESSSNALTGNDTLSLAVSNSGEATRSPCIFRPSKAFFLLVPQAAAASGSHSLPLSIIGIARNGRGKTFTPPSAFLPPIRPEQHARPRHAQKQQQKQQRPQGQMWISLRVPIMVGLTPET